MLIKNGKYEKSKASKKLIEYFKHSGKYECIANVRACNGCHPMYPECVAFLRKNMRVREIVVLVRVTPSLSLSGWRPMNAF